MKSEPAHRRLFGTPSEDLYIIGVGSKSIKTPEALPKTFQGLLFVNQNGSPALPAGAGVLALGAALRRAESELIE